jgi:hypothetical protein
LVGRDTYEQENTSLHWDNCGTGINLAGGLFGPGLLLVCDVEQSSAHGCEGAV